MRTALLLGCLLTAWSPAAASTFLDRSVTDWLTVLKGADKAQARRSAAFALSRMGQAGSLALADLADRVRDDRDAPVRDMAAQAIGDIVLSFPIQPASAWESCGPVLREAVRRESDSRVKRSAVYALGAFGPTAAAARDVLKAALADRSPAVRQNAAWALGRLGAQADAGCIDSLRDRLADDSPLVRRDAAQALGTLALSASRKAMASAGRPLIEMARRDTDDVARKAALAALATVAGPEHAGTAGELHPLLESRDAETARGAAFALAAVGGEHARKAMPVMRLALTDPEAAVQALAAAGLASAGPDAASAVEDLARALSRSKDPVVRRNCIIALGQIGPKAEAGVPAIAAALTVSPESPPKVREYAGEALSHIKYPQNRKGLAAVRKAIASDPSQDVRLRCVEALFQIRTPRDLDEHDLTKTLEKVLDETGSESTLVRYNCARVLAVVFADKVSDRAIDTLMDMLHNRTIRIFYETRAAIEGGATESSAGTTGVAERTGGDARHLAAEALGWTGRKSADNPKVMEALRKAATDPEPNLADRAKKALAVLGAGR